MANIYVVNRTDPELLKVLVNLKTNFKITRITKSLKINENIDSDSVPSPKQTKWVGTSRKWVGTKIDWTFAHKHWYFTATNYALF